MSQEAEPNVAALCRFRTLDSQNEQNLTLAQPEGQRMNPQKTKIALEQAPCLNDQESE